MKKKYKILKDSNENSYGVKLYRIIAIRSFGNVKRGELGGWIESEKNLSHKGDCWIDKNSIVCGDAVITDNVKISGNAIIIDAFIMDNVKIYGNAKIIGHSFIHKNAKIYGNAEIYDEIEISDNVQIYGNSNISGQFINNIYGDAKIYNNNIKDANIIFNIKNFILTICDI